MKKVVMLVAVLGLLAMPLAGMSADQSIASSLQKGCACQQAGGACAKAGCCEAKACGCAEGKACNHAVCCNASCGNQKCSCKMMEEKSKGAKRGR